MSFAGKVWRLLVGIKDGLALVFLLLFFGLLFAALSSRPNKGVVREGALLLELNGTVVEEVAPLDPLTLLVSTQTPSRQIAARDLVHAIDSAAGDSRIKALALDMTTFLGAGAVHLEEIGAALDRFRRAKKPVLAYAVAYTDDSLLLAAHASEVWVDPMGGAAISGPGGTRLYYAGLLDRFKVKAHVFRVGTFKSAVEPYLLAGMSPEARENAQAYTGALWSEWQANVKLARPQANVTLATQQVPQWVEANKGDMAKAALAAGLVDKLGTYEEWGKRLAELAGKDNWDNAPGAFAKTELDAWLAEVEPDVARRGFTATPTIGVVTIAGEISDGSAGPGEAGAERIVTLLDDALDKGFKALVVRVDSPGGTVTGSEAIRRAILRYKAKNIPIVVSMGNLAASGGYWVATPAERIFAQPETITGSIGIYGVLPSFEGALAQYGVTTDGVQTTPLSGQPDILGGLSPEAEAVLQGSVDAGYVRFVNLVAQSRKLAPERVDEIAQGRVWDGGTAKQIGLVDQFGGLDQALEWAASRAKLPKGGWQPVYLGADASPYPGWLGRLLGPGRATQGRATGGDLFALLAARREGLLARAMADLDGLMQVRGMQARCLECPVPAALLPPSPSSRLSTGALGWLARLAGD